MKDKKITLVLAIALLAGFAIAWVTIKDDRALQNTAQTTTSEQPVATMHEEYPGLPENSRFTREPAEKIIERYEKGSGIIFLGFKECSWCQKAAPLLNEAAETGDVAVYYLDIRKEQEDDSLQFQKIIDILAPHLPKDERGQPRLSVPDISFVSDGEIFWRYEMEATTEDERTPDAYWTEARKDRALQRFRDQMKNLE